METARCIRSLQFAMDRKMNFPAVIVAAMVAHSVTLRDVNAPSSTPARVRRGII